MKKIYTGKGYISALTLLAIWSLSLVVDLPGLAVSPVVSVIDKVFPGSTQLECQLLEILPNFCIFPFILLSGKLSESRNKVSLVVTGLVIFLASGIAYFFSDDIVSLIIVSCTLGMGCGLIIPLAAGLLAETFVGRFRLQQMGIKSGIANFTLVFATLIVGLIEGKNWHLPFVVYLIAIVPLLMSVFLTKRFMSANNALTVTDKPKPGARKTAVKAVSASQSNAGLSKMDTHSASRKIWGIIIFYLLVTVTGITLSFYIPFLMQKHGMSDAATGYVSAVFYLALTVPGFWLGRVVCLFRNFTIPACVISMIAGLLIIPFMPHLWAYFAGAILVGFGYGALQPIFYDKAAVLAPSSANSTKMLSYIMAANYLGVAVCPLFFAGLGSVLAFVISAGVMAVVLVMSLIFRHWFIFNVANEIKAYEEQPASAPGTANSTKNG